MNKFVPFAALLLFIGCGSSDSSKDNPKVTYKSCTITKADKHTNIDCPDGTSAEVTDGENCSVISVSTSIDLPYGGSIITCGATSSLIANGKPGDKGVPGPVSSYSIVDKIDPCGDAPGIYDEVFLLLADGTLIWSLSDDISGKNTRLSVAQDGSWMTTDGSSCTFTVSTIGNNRTLTSSSGSKTWSVQ